VQKTVIEAIGKGLVRSAHDCSEGGFAVALAECCITNPKRRFGVNVHLNQNNIRADALMFGESQSRIILSARGNDVAKILQIAHRNKAPVAVIGKVGGKRLVVEGLIDKPVDALYKAWSKAIKKFL